MCHEQHLKKHRSSPSDVHIVPNAGVAVRDGHNPIPTLHKLGRAVLCNIVITSLTTARKAGSPLVHLGFCELVLSVVAQCMLDARLGKKEFNSRNAGACLNRGDKAQSGSPSVNTAHMVWWADSHLEHVLDPFCAMHVLCDVNAMA